MSSVDDYFKARFTFLYKIQRISMVLWPRFGRLFEGLLDFAVDIATDDLSGFHVRKIFYLRLNDLIAPIASQVLLGTAREKIVLVLFDIAMLNFANKGGHDAGNSYIRRVATALKVAERDLYELGAELVFIGRLGGDEFGMVSVGLEKHEVETVIRKAQAEVAKADFEHIDAGISDLSDPSKISEQRDENGVRLVASHPGRGALRAAVRRLDLIADERANIAKAAARISLLAMLLEASPDVYEEILKFAMKAVSTVDEMELEALAEKLRKGEDIQLDALALALRVRQEAMSDDLFTLAVFRVAERDFFESSH